AAAPLRTVGLVRGKRRHPLLDPGRPVRGRGSGHLLLRMGCRTVSANANADLAELTSWDSNWKGLRVVVAGLGLSGFSAADTLIELGAVVTVLDGRDDELNRQRGETLMIVGAHQVLLGSEHVKHLPQVNDQQPQL